MYRTWYRKWHWAIVNELKTPRATKAEPRKSPWLSTIYGYVIAALRAGRLARARRISPPSVPVISVGNVTFGGTGKTPLVALLLNRIVTAERTPMLLSRGVGDDEWKQLANSFPSCRLAIGSDRVKVAEQILQADKGVQCIVVDDGLQQWALKKDLEIVTVDAMHPFGNGWLLPWGSLREHPVDAIRRADIVVLHHANLIHTTQLQGLKDQVRACFDPQRESFMATTEMEVVELRKICTPLSSTNSNKQRVKTLGLVFCGVGNPKSVQQVAKQMQKWDDIAIELFPDHYCFSKHDFENLCKLINIYESKGYQVTLLTTEKDYFRCQRLMEESFHCYDFRVLSCEMRVVENKDGFYKRIDEIILI